MKEFWWIWREISLWGRGGAGIYLGVAILWNLLFNAKYREIRQYPRNTAKKLKLWLNFVRGTIFSRKWQQYMINFFLLYVKNIHRYADRYFFNDIYMMKLFNALVQIISIHVVLPQNCHKNFLPRKYCKNCFFTAKFNLLVQNHSEICHFIIPRYSEIRQNLSR